MTLTKEDVIKRINQTVAKANRLYEINLSLIAIEFGNTMTASAGIAKYDGKGKYSIKISVPYMESYPELIIKETIPHEVAHTVCFALYDARKPNGDLGHGDGWKEVAKALGATPEAKYQIPQDKRPAKVYYRYVDDKGTEIDLPVKYHRMLQDQYRVLRTDAGTKITASGYKGTIKK